MDFRILGRLEVLEEGRDVAPTRPKPRALLALLLLHANRPVTTDRLLEALWGDEPPDTADKALQGHISTLRKLLGASRIETTPGAYRLVVEAGELDADRFALALGGARAQPDPRARARSLTDALATWRGEPLADLATERFAHGEIGRLTAHRLTALEAWAEAAIAAGEHAEAAAELERLVGEHPSSEGLRASLMLALYRAGRQSDALRVYREGRRYLAEELGIDPGPELQLLERQILGHDQVLDLPARAAPDAQAPRQERKIVTVLVVEVVPTGEPDLEDLEKAVQPALDQIRAIVEQVGGRAEPLFANALVGMFGAPRAHDDDALRGVRAALDLLGANAPTGVRLRGGIETGEALVTVDGGDVSLTGHVLGAASRLQVMAPMGSILTGPSTYRATEGSVEYAAVEHDAWVPQRVRRAHEHVRADAPFVGRADELGQLERILARASEGRSVQLATITAEPGGGKSRLVRELRTRLEGSAGGQSAPRWLQGRCLPYGNGLTFWALGEVVKAWAGILESDDAAVAADKLAAALGALEPDESRRTWFARSVAPLAGIGDAVAAGDREQGFAAWRQLVETIAAERPLVVTFEDIHWADEALLAFIDHLVEHAAEVPLLVICTARPELLDSQPTWSAGKRNAATILLQPLSQAEMGRLLEAHLGRPPEPDTVRRAGGNPLYALELARLISDPSADMAVIPESLQAVIAAHLDALSPDLKAVAADASIVGEVFWPGVVAEIGAADPASVEARLHRLVTNEVVRRRRLSTVAGQAEYEFLHVLVRDVAYGQIPRRDRIAKHRRAAAWIGRLAEDRPTAHAEFAAHHYLEALELARRHGQDDLLPELAARASATLSLAGDGARTLDAGKAAGLYRRALHLLPDGDPGRGSLLARLGDVAQLAGDLEESERSTRMAIDALLAADDDRTAAAAMVTLESVAWRLGRAEGERRELLHEAIRLLEALPPGPELVLAYAQTAAHELYAGSSASCLAWSSRALGVAQALGVPALQFQPRQYVGIARFEQGDASGIDDVRAAIELGLETGLSWETAHAKADLGAMVWLQEGPGPAIPLKSEAAAFADDHGMTALAETTRAQMLWMQYDAGLWGEVLAASSRLESSAADRRGRVTMMALSARSRVLVGRGRSDDAVALAAEVLATGRAVGDAQDLAPSLVTAAYVHSAAGDGDAAVALLMEMEERSRGLDLSRRAHDLALAARLCLVHGAEALARSFLDGDGQPAPTRARLGIATARAVVAEASGDADTASRAYAIAARGWASYGCPEEEAHALLGAARCHPAPARRNGDSRALRRALEIGRSLGAVAIVDEAHRLLARSSRADARQAVG